MFNAYDNFKYALLRYEAKYQDHFGREFGTTPEEMERWRASLREWQVAFLEEQRAFEDWQASLA